MFVEIVQLLIGNFILSLWPINMWPTQLTLYHDLVGSDRPSKCDLGVFCSNSSHKAGAPHRPQTEQTIGCLSGILKSSRIKEPGKAAELRS